MTEPNSKPNSKPSKLDQLLADEQQFPEEISPRRDLWPGIEQAISQLQAKPSRGLSINQRIALASAASILCAVLLMSFIKPLAPGPEQPLDGINALVNTYEQEKQQLLVNYRGQPPLADNWQQQLQQLEQAASSLRGALEQEPDNAVLIRMLANIYQQQLDLINKVHSPKWQQI